MKSVDIRIVFDRDLDPLEAERVSESMARQIKVAMVDGRLRRYVDIRPGGEARVQSVQRAPGRK